MNKLVASAELVNVPVPLRDLWNANRCPVNLLPFLAWACSVDRWDDAWPESIMRGAIKAAYFIHKHKGKVTHSLGGSGFTTRVEFETKTEAVEAEREDENDPDEGITGVVAKWKDVAAKKKKAGQEQAGGTGTLKTLEHTYKSKQAAKRAALNAWRHIEEVRDIIRENSEEKQKP
ncbi:phage tail protein I [Janthinobacterium sp. PSPC1-1]|uniref:phage tail protein I n=1 Tax=Janthinobacterium sp. PSPC1-1 TaxID=2804581 RepID=UPI003CF4BB6B